MKTKTKIFLSAIASLLIAGCGGGGGSSTTANTTGTVADGYIYNAKVCYKGTDICAYTDASGKFTLPAKDLPIVAYPEKGTTNMATTNSFNSALVAPAGMSVISPLSTALYAVGDDYDILAKDLNVTVSELKNYINKDIVSLAESDKNASDLYGKSVILEKITDTIMYDSNTSDINKKLDALKALLLYTNNNNKSLSQLNQNDMQAVFTGYKSMVTEPVSDINKTKISIIASSLASSLDNNFTSNVPDIEKHLSSIDYNSMMSLDDNNLTLASNSLKNAVVNTAESNGSIYVVASTDILHKTLNSSIPDINATGYVYEQNLSADNTVSLVNGKDFNVSSGAEFNAVLSNESSNFLTFNDGSLVSLNQNGNIILKVNTADMKNPIEKAVLTLTPKNGDVTGKSKQILIVVRNVGVSNTSTAEVHNITIQGNSNYQLNDNDKIVDVKISNPADSKFIFAASSNNNVADIQDFNDTDVFIQPVSDGNAKVSIASLDTNNSLTFQTYNITVNGIDLPPVLNVSSTYINVVKNAGENADVNISYAITDADNINNGYSVSGCNTTADGEDNNITCSFDTAGLHKVTLTASDGYLNSASVSVYVNVIEGNVPPTLTLFTPDEVDMQTMSTAVYSFTANDLNGADTFEVNATSSNPDIVKVIVDKNTSTITLLAQPKTGSATVTVYAQDSSGLKSPSYTFTVKTTNEMATLIPALYIVPPLDSNGELIDSRYKLSNFNASYNIADDNVIINGDINTTDGNVTLTNFILQSYPDEALYAGKGTTANGYSYGFVFSNGFEYDGEFKNGRVLVFDENNSQPYYWALATKDQICDAYGDNNQTINLINSLNNNTPIDCNK